MGIVDVTLANAPALVVRRDLLAGRVHYFCSEYCEYGDFQNFDKSNFDEATTKYIFRQVMETIKSFHERKWYHQDIKLENIFVARVKDKFVFKIGDFGRLTLRQSEAEHETGRAMQRVCRVVDTCSAFLNMCVRVLFCFYVFTCRNGQMLWSKCRKLLCS